MVLGGPAYYSWHRDDVPLALVLYRQEARLSAKSIGESLEVSVMPSGNTGTSLGVILEAFSVFSHHVSVKLNTKLM